MLLYPAAVIVYFYIFTISYARVETRTILAGEKPVVRVEFVYPNALTPASVTTMDGTIVATTVRYMFLFEGPRRAIHVVQTGAVRQITAAQSAR